MTTQVVWKYVLEQPFLMTELEVPWPAQSLSVAIQRDKICVWFLASPGNNESGLCTKVTVRIIVLPTGIPMPGAYRIVKCIGVCHLDKIEGHTRSLSLEKAVEVYHVFEVEKIE